MDRSVAVLILGGLLAAEVLTTGATAEQSGHPLSAMDTEAASVKAPLPAAPLGKSTIMGGEIQKLDTVRDQFQLKAFGQKPMTILFDERTQVYLDGKRIRLRDMHSESTASIQTVLDGTSVFAISIHLLSREPEGEFHGQVLSYNPDSRELTVSASSSREPVKLVVPMNTPITRQGQIERPLLRSGLSDLVKGTLVSLTFEPNKQGQGITNAIEVLAIPGSAFVFGGSLSSLDMHSGLMSVIDPGDRNSYQIVFDPSKFPTSQAWHEGDSVRVVATFDGSRYVADSVAVN